MHELTMAENAIEIIIKNARMHGIEKIEKVCITIGRLTFIEKNQITFWLKELSKGTIMQSCEIEIEESEGMISCMECDYEGPLAKLEEYSYHVFAPSFSCPACKSGKIKIIKGLEFEITKITGKDYKRAQTNK